MIWTNLTKLVMARNKVARLLREIATRRRPRGRAPRSPRPLRQPPAGRSSKTSKPRGRISARSATRSTPRRPRACSRFKCSARSPARTRADRRAHQGRHEGGASARPTSGNPGLRERRPEAIRPAIRRAPAVYLADLVATPRTGCRSCAGFDRAQLGRGRAGF